ncbi:CHASE2 domain-containing protein [Nostoc sp. NMS8]|uniref:CHASE2 domain-containing protein n=1 Tax=Nostoc sp. NMS8 TaxID=2815392 RepID=UPI0025D2435E|nr:CHASE2 domain-containing protein [Nostoc sp. NMS8]MBN3958725.1 CHASE2 domain-containing protein [Nostoc sp. NMS8]
MKLPSHIFNLKVHKIEQTCLFELSWGQGQRLNAQVSYPNTLTQLYQEWRRAYLNFYQSEHLRGRTVGGGVATITVDLHAELVKAESKLMYEFHRWLRSGELYEIRGAIAQASQELVKANLEPTTIQVFLTCAPIELDRFPWEAWEIGTEFATTGAIQLIRAPLNIGDNTVNYGKLKQRRARILAILGDDTGLNFQKEKEALESLLRIADVTFTGWQPEQTPSQVIQQITDAIADEQGWDVLFFAGHSNETEMTGGELSIAPGVSISINEIASQLSAAKKRGLQVAIFNSCSGLNIADSLIDLGFSQVVVMREPIHNRIAQEFLVLFLQGLGKHLDIYESMMAARQSLRSHTYPSAYLVPSLFCHPGGKLFCIPPFEWKQRLRQFLPSSLEAIALTASLVLSLIPGVQEILLDGRILTQSVYRQITTQIPSDEAPPVALVEIDTESISRANLPNSQLHPMNRSYIAKLIDRAKNLNAAVVGVDFVFDSPQTNPRFGDRDLGKAVRQAVDGNMWLIFGAILTSNQELGVSNLTAIAHRNWTLQGYTDADPYRVELPGDCNQTCPIAYLMSLVQTANQEISGLPQPQTTRVTNLRTQLLDTIQKKQPEKGNLPFLLQIHSFLGLQPLIDFSIPNDQIYTKIPAWKLLENSATNKFPLISKQVVLIASGNDERLGIAPGQPDYSPAPSAMNYWTQQSSLTGGESLAYMTHHFLTRRLVIPIPDILMIGVAIIIGKIAILALRKQSNLSPQLRLKIIIASLSVVIAYGIAALQIYISAAILLPWFLPSSVFLTYVLSTTKKKHHAQPPTVFI